MVCSHCGSAPPAPARRSKSAVFARARGVGSAPRERRPPPPPARTRAAPGACARSTEPIEPHTHPPSSFMAPGSSCSSGSVLQSVRCSRGSRPCSFVRADQYQTRTNHIHRPLSRLSLLRAAFAFAPCCAGARRKRPGAQLFPPRPRAQLSRARRVPGEGDAGRYPARVSPCGGTLAATRRARGTR